ncbi:uncharacterized protein LOC116422296 isoform X2 [Sarcophilus harrisii]|nr:uncharacterized protein LOC116422296 isoform X2 [Sarcophilus harrisii]
MPQDIWRRELNHFWPFCSFYNSKFGEGKLSSESPTFLNRPLKRLLNFNVSPKNESDTKKQPSKLRHPRKYFFQSPKIALLPCLSPWIASLPNQHKQSKSRLMINSLNYKSRSALLPPSNSWTMTAGLLHVGPYTRAASCMFSDQWTMTSSIINPRAALHMFSDHWTMTSSIINPCQRTMAKLLTQPKSCTIANRVSHSYHQPNTSPLFYSDHLSKAIPLSLPDHRKTILSLPYLKKSAKATKAPFSRSWVKHTDPIVSLPNLKNLAKPIRASIPKSWMDPIVSLLNLKNPAKATKTPLPIENAAPTLLPPYRKNRVSVPHLPQLEHYKETPFYHGNQTKPLSNCYQLPKTPQNSGHKAEHQPKLIHWSIPPVYPSHKTEVLLHSFSQERTKPEVSPCLVNKAKATAIPFPGPNHKVRATTVSSSCLGNQRRVPYVSSSSCFHPEIESNPNVEAAAADIPSLESFPFHQDTLPSDLDNKDQSAQKTELPPNLDHCNKSPKSHDQETQKLLNFKYPKEATVDTNHHIQEVQPPSGLVYLKPYVIRGGNIPLKTINSIINSIPPDKIKTDLRKQILLRRMRGYPNRRPGPPMSSSYVICLKCASWIPFGCIHLKEKRDSCRAILVVTPTPISGPEPEMGIRFIFKIPKQKSYHCEDQSNSF